MSNSEVNNYNPKNCLDKWVHHRECWKNRPISSQICIGKLSYCCDGFCFVIIHKKAFLKCVKENQDIFNKIYGRKVSPKEILERFISGKYSLEEAHKKSDLALGILLGFGERNAQIFQRRKEIDPSWGGRSKRASEGFKNVEEELAYLKKAYWDTQKSFIFSDLNPLFLSKDIGCIADYNSTETKTILKRYEKAYKKALRLYAGKNFLDVTLTFLEN